MVAAGREIAVLATSAHVDSVPQKADLRVTARVLHVKGIALDQTVTDHRATATDQKEIVDHATVNADLVMLAALLAVTAPKAPVASALRSVCEDRA